MTLRTLSLWLSVAALVPGCAAPPSPAPTAAAGQCPLGLSEWGANLPASDRSIAPVLNRIGVDAQGALSWNGSAVTAEAVRQYLQITAAMSPRPLLLVEADADAPCAAVSNVVAMADSVLDCSPRLCRIGWTRR